MFPIALAEIFAPIVSDLIDRAFPDSEKREQERLAVMQKMQEAANQLDLAQMEVNKEEAGNPSVFVAGWRAFIGWICGFAFAYHYIIQPFLAFCFAAAGHPVPLPAFDMDTLTTVLMGMLGLGGLRSFEKVRGVATTQIAGRLPWQK